MQYVKQVYTITDDLLLKKQFSYIIARHVFPFPVLRLSCHSLHVYVSGYLLCVHVYYAYTFIHRLHRHGS
jgi:hypothetical protein